MKPKEQKTFHAAADDRHSFNKGGVNTLAPISFLLWRWSSHGLPRKEVNKSEDEDGHERTCGQASAEKPDSLPGSPLPANGPRSFSAMGLQRTPLLSRARRSEPAQDPGQSFRATQQWKAGMPICHELRPELQRTLRTRGSHPIQRQPAADQDRADSTQRPSPGHPASGSSMSMSSEESRGSSCQDREGRRVGEMP